MTSMILGFIAVSNLYANVNNNNQVHYDLHDPGLHCHLQPLCQREQKNQVHDDIYDPRLWRRLQPLRQREQQ